MKLKVTKAKLYIALFVLLSGLLFLGYRYWEQREALENASERADQLQSQARIKEIAELDFQRAGRVKVNVLDLDDDKMVEQPTRISYSLLAPAAVVEDTDIRGYLYGSSNYPFNQATSYHMRVGRRYSDHRGEYELKRSLIRWTLPPLPKDARVVSASVSFWVEEYYGASPLARSDAPILLHLYLYPLSPDWGPGQGGINKDSFSPAAPGEVSWTEARTEERQWPAPGVLALDLETPTQKYEDEPLAIGTIEQGSSWLTVSSESLAEYLQRSFDETGTMNLLLKLDDQEEDRWGTETAFFTSNFGGDKDVASKRPRLDFEVEVDVPAISVEEEFILESGMENILPVLKHPGRSGLLSVEITPDDEGIPPEIWIRGGKKGGAPQDDWIRYNQPLEIQWDWSQVKLSTAFNRLSWDEPFSINILETWVEPGPREAQLPEMILVAPSGKTHKVEGQAMPDLSYLIEFRPQELGLWRYGWSFRPRLTHPIGSHRAEGFFYVDIPNDGSGAQRLEQYADHVITSLRAGEVTDRALQWQVNSFIRQAVRFAQLGPLEQQTSERLIGEVRQVLAERDKAKSNRSRLERLVQRVKQALVF